MRVVTAYLMDGRGQSADGRRKATPLPIVSDDQHDAVEGPVEPALDTDWVEGDDTAAEPTGETEEDETTAEADEDTVAAANDTDADSEVELAKVAAPASRDPYAAYMSALRDVKRLDREEEHELAVEYLATHDPKIARTLITANLKLVVKLAHEYSRAARNLLDLIQEGNVGLVQAVEKYDPHRNVKLSSYAAWWIRAYMLRYILQNARIVRLGTTATQRKLFFNLRKEKAKLERLGFVPSAERVALAMNVPEAEVLDMEQRMGSPDASLDAPIDREDPGRTRLDTIEAANDRPDVAAENGEFKERLHEVLTSFGAKLKGRDRQLFDERLMTAEPRTLQQLGDTFGISRERTRQLEMRLMGRLKMYLTAQLGDAVELERLSA
ncbi:MAG: putative polymerase, sigma 70 family subunit [Myxococcales bacterium]|nr:putative polymerase, sigma 70 family subunit [Myxococcales bacterium]